MIPLIDKPNVDTTNPDFPFGKIKDDSGIGDGTPVTHAVYNDLHQLAEKIVADSGITPNGLVDNETNGYQLYQALQEVVAYGFPGVASGAWENGSVPSVTCNTGSATIPSIATNRYKIIGKTFFWEFVGALSVTSGSPTTVKISHPVTIAQKNFNTATPRKVWGHYKTNIQTLCEMQLTTIDITIPPSTAFSGTNQYLHFFVELELA